MIKLTKDFYKDEFECPCCGECPMDEKFLEKLQTVRTTLNRVINVNSGYRCKKHNKKINGKRNSAHLLGLAADLRISSSRDRALIIKYCFDVGINRIGIGKSFIHVDMADESTGHPPWAMWHYYD